MSGCVVFLGAMGWVGTSCKQVHSASERSVGYVFLTGDSVRNHPNPHPYQTDSQELDHPLKRLLEGASSDKIPRLLSACIISPSAMFCGVVLLTAVLSSNLELGPSVRQR